MQPGQVYMTTARPSAARPHVRSLRAHAVVQHFRLSQQTGCRNASMATPKGAEIPKKTKSAISLGLAEAHAHTTPTTFFCEPTMITTHRTWNEPSKTVKQTSPPQKNRQHPNPSMPADRKKQSTQNMDDPRQRYWSTAFSTNMFNQHEPQQTAKPRRKKYHQPEIFDLCSAMQRTERKQRSTCVLPICSAKQPRHDQQQPTSIGLVNHRSTRVGSATPPITCIKSTVRPSLNWESQHATCNNTDEASATAWSRQRTTILSLSDGSCSPSAVRRAPTRFGRGMLRVHCGDTKWSVRVLHKQHAIELYTLANVQSTSTVLHTTLTGWKLFEHKLYRRSNHRANFWARV